MIYTFFSYFSEYGEVFFCPLAGVGDLLWKEVRDQFVSLAEVGGAPKT